MDIELTFADSVSDAYQQRLQQIVDNFLSQGVSENRPPYIEFPSMENEILEKLEKLREDYEYQN